MKKINILILGVFVSPLVFTIACSEKSNQSSIDGNKSQGESKEGGQDGDHQVDKTPKVTSEEDEQLQQDLDTSTPSSKYSYNKELLYQNDQLNWLNFANQNKMEHDHSSLNIQNANDPIIDNRIVPNVSGDLKNDEKGDPIKEWKDVNKLHPGFYLAKSDYQGKFFGWEEGSENPITRVQKDKELLYLNQFFYPFDEPIIKEKKFALQIGVQDSIYLILDSDTKDFVQTEEQVKQHLDTDGNGFPNFNAMNNIENLKFVDTAVSEPWNGKDKFFVSNEEKTEGKLEKYDFSMSNHTEMEFDKALYEIYKLKTQGHVSEECYEKITTYYNVAKEPNQEHKFLDGEALYALGQKGFVPLLRNQEGYVTWKKIARNAYQINFNSQLNSTTAAELSFDVPKYKQKVRSVKLSIGGPKEWESYQKPSEEYYLVGVHNQLT